MARGHRFSSSNFIAVRRLTEYARDEDASENEELTIPEDLTGLSNEDLGSLTDQAVAAFEAIYGDGDVSDDEVEQLGALADGIEALRAEQLQRDEAQSERSGRAAEIAARVRPEAEQGEGEADEESGEADESEDVEDETDETSEEAEAEEETEEQPEAVAASARREVRVSLSGLRSRQGGYNRPTDQRADSDTESLLFSAPDLPGYANGQEMSWDDVGRGVDRRLTAFNHAQFDAARRSNRHIRNQYGVAVIRKPFSEDLIVNELSESQNVLDRAVDETRLPGGSLVAAGGWCAPSETVYDLCEPESRDGLVSIPEVQVNRGGIRFTQGPDFSQIFEDTGFCYTEQEDIDGDYDGEGGGSKPCFNVPCPDFEDHRLDLCGTCITAGLLQAKGYPEVIARTIRGALVAHEHRLAGNVINALIGGSTAVSFPAGQAGAAAPILTAIELQAEHLKGSQRLSRGTSLEAIFPFWVHGAIRADLSRRLGVDMLSVPNARVNQWFGERGINPQYVYNWQGLETTAASGLTGYPEEINFLMYPAGTWVKGSSDIISLDTVYDSTMLGTNDYTALFAEEGWLVAKRCHDSRLVTVPICADGATAAGVEISCDGVGA